MSVGALVLRPVEKILKVFLRLGQDLRRAKMAHGNLSADTVLVQLGPDLAKPILRLLAPGQAQLEVVADSDVAHC